jgi:hypothetical protein
MRCFAVDSIGNEATHYKLVEPCADLPGYLTFIYPVNSSAFALSAALAVRVDWAGVAAIRRSWLFYFLCRSLSDPNVCRDELFKPFVAGDGAMGNDTALVISRFGRFVNNYLG